MIRRPPRSTQSRSSAASDVYKRQEPEQVPQEDQGALQSKVSLLDQNIQMIKTGEKKELSTFEKAAEEETRVLDSFDNHATPLISVKERAKDIKYHKSVSYTHLRAHETVLDLVCRLLLEKKKKIQSKTL
eukprot:TRINITY_DN7538_c0_g1_i1.p1 TRINITY_DN7538_c0_g1~~TRINITY_DN7538_c0_g1_i1.p1  ORF type:complete len:130 (-),score=91.68 TRINITY_DN7538_c0_g1_i1:33-422(-)